MRFHCLFSAIREAEEWRDASKRSLTHGLLLSGSAENGNPGDMKSPELRWRKAAGAKPALRKDQEWASQRLSVKSTKYPMLMARGIKSNADADQVSGKCSMPAIAHKV